MPAVSLDRLCVHVELVHVQCRHLSKLNAALCAAAVMPRPWNDLCPAGIMPLKLAVVQPECSASVEPWGLPGNLGMPASSALVDKGSHQPKGQLPAPAAPSPAAGWLGPAEMGASPPPGPPGRAGSPPGHAEEVEQPGGPAGPLAGPCSSSPSSESMPKSSVEAAADLKLSAQPQVEAPSPQALGGLAASPSCGPRRAVTLGARASRVRLPMSLPQAPRLPTVTLAPGRGSKPITAAVSTFNVSCDFEFE